MSFEFLCVFPENSSLTDFYNIVFILFLVQLIIAHALSFTEFMSRGSVYDFLHKQRGVFNLPSLLKVAINISRGMNYLHQNNIIHRDLKTANLLMDENMVREVFKTAKMRNIPRSITIYPSIQVVKVADFGVARVQTQSGVMTAETGTYRWMAPEVCVFL